MEVTLGSVHFRVLGYTVGRQVLTHPVGDPRPGVVGYNVVVPRPHVGQSGEAITHDLWGVSQAVSWGCLQHTVGYHYIDMLLQPDLCLAQNTEQQYFHKD